LEELESAQKNSPIEVDLIWQLPAINSDRDWVSLVEELVCFTVAVLLM
jgi:hypothetical protein